MLCVKPTDIAKIDTAAEVRGVPVLTLMRRAGDAVADAIMAARRPCRVLILCGGGNNGGDGYAAALRLYGYGYTVTAVDLLGKGQRSEAGQYFYREYESILGAPSVLSLPDAIGACDVIVDAIFGTGCAGTLSDSVCEAIALANASGALRVAVDLPTGIDGASGRVGATSFHADLTVTLGFYKVGSLSYPARAECGEMILAELGFLPCDTDGIEGGCETLTPAELRQLLGSRPQNSHKGSFGTAYLYCGSALYRGAAVLAVGGALRIGVGLCAIASVPSVTEQVLAAYPEAICKDQGESPAGADAILCGCGLGVTEYTKSLVRELLTQDGAPLVLDADALNALAAMPDGNILLKNATRSVVLTPHPLEFARLTGRTVSEVQAVRLTLAQEYAQENRVTLVLKGAGTVIADKSGRVFINRSGSSALAKGGSGDVLAGAITGLLAQGISPADAAAAAVFLHGVAGDTLAAEYSEYGVLPHELPRQMARELQAILS
ncbi:MAG: NAD(P)H-hydrate dehydratase [Clostridia bacterium]|nr:NAD(P)H-hydrate dehydratase [Clostridia bacterium]